MTERNTVQRIRSPVLIRTDAWSQIETFISGVSMICENKRGNQYCCTFCVTLVEIVWTPCDHLIQVKTIEKVLLGLHKWWLWLLNRGRNYSRSREVIFRALKTDRLIRCHLIQVRLYIQSIRITVCYFVGSWETSSKKPTSLVCLAVFSLEMERDTYLLLR